MADARVELSGINTLEKRLRNVIRPAQDEFASRIMDRLFQEVPRKSGNLLDSISVEVTREYKNTYVTRINIGNAEVPYAFAVWKGLDPTEYTISPKKGGIMAFPVDAWPTYVPGEWEPDGGYFFTAMTLRNYIPPNDFIGRALTDLNEAKYIWRKYIKVLSG
jgi:hypothetical protein